MTPFVKLLAEPAFDILQDLRMLAYDMLRLSHDQEPPTAWVSAIVHGRGRGIRDALRSKWEDQVTLRSEVASICAQVALGDVDVGRGRSLLRRACVALRELGVTHEDIERVIRRRAAEPVELAS